MERSRAPRQWSYESRGKLQVVEFSEWQTTESPALHPCWAASRRVWKSRRTVYASRNSSWANALTIWLLRMLASSDHIRGARRIRHG